MSTKNNVSLLIIVEGRSAEDLKDISESFNDYFVSVLVITYLRTSYLKNTVIHSLIFFFPTVTEEIF